MMSKPPWLFQNYPQAIQYLWLLAMQRNLDPLYMLEVWNHEEPV